MGAALPSADLAAFAKLAAGVLVAASLMLVWWWLRHRAGSPRERLAALTALTLFLSFDLVVFGAFTRLSDSGLGCPDWPGCYGQASPLGAEPHIDAAQAAQPSGPVTWHKAWIEMVHRYLAMTVGVLIIGMTVVAWRARAALPRARWWALATLAWVVLQGLFGRYTVTLKLYPAIVTVHLLGGLLLLALLTLQLAQQRDAPLVARPALRVGAAIVLALLVVQIALGGWVSTNYAVLACRGFPTCNGEWWPPANFEHAFVALRELGRTGAGSYLPSDPLVAIHLTHRIGAVVALTALAWLALALARTAVPRLRRCALLIALLSLAQLGTGLGNVVLDWPIVGALGHSAGAAALVIVLVSLLARTLGAREQTSQRAATHMRLA
jgi:cytochrome c oxidase assembly protein subunit 15